MAQFDMSINDTVLAAGASPTIGLMDKARALKAGGKDIISLAGGEPDMPPAEATLAAALARIQSRQVSYGPVAGLADLRAAIATDIKSRHGLEYRAQDVVVGIGAKQVLAEALMVGTQPGDEIIIPAPYWVSYPAMARLAGGIPVIVETSASSGFKITPEALKAAITPLSRWLILNSPSNPTGAVYTRSELAAIARIVQDHTRLLVLSDDIYEDILFDGNVHTTIASVDAGLIERSVLCSGFSKGHAMTGLRVGYAVGPEWLIKPMIDLQSHLTSGGCVVGQAASTAALREAADFPAQCVKTYSRRRGLGLGILKDSDRITVVPPQGAFYFWIDISRLLGMRSPTGSAMLTDTEVADALLEAGLALVPGSAFGLSPYLRMSFAAADEVIEEGCWRLVKFCNECTLATESGSVVTELPQQFGA
ncbi:pyridoxal phosphate-dependent aminotransferase [Rhizobium lentis]|uniref:pyridoxal phosphate-dependent aminotransferase n=1 Tax=Rhizobium lentis TaxID=1138194 RepID=UPI001C831EEC|nr:pyridoxal phosphate-dependent aminotransferase [Rhizobium lentis]MBX5137673.1 pyridoxal phosphate-dependent aminotransferase [Rhizobium lentis]